jgi:glycine betaine/proline transport system permease protein
MDWLYRFPNLDNATLTNLKKAIDETFRNFTRAYGDAIEGFFNPLQYFLIQAERFMTGTPWPVILLLIAAIAWFSSRSIKITIGSVITLFIIGYLGMWEDTMKTISMIFVCTVIAILVGIPTGILMAKSNRLQSVISPVLDIMQTMPSFVYLIPVVMLLGIGRVPGLIAVVIYAIPPIIRLTNLGIRQVDRDVLEAADAFGSSPWQKLKNVQLPLALPTIMAGINQTIMMALAMVVIASMIGVRGLGYEVLQGINRLQVGRGVLAGLGIVIIAIIFDRITQEFGRRQRKGA